MITLARIFDVTVGGKHPRNSAAALILLAFAWSVPYCQQRPAQPLPIADDCGATSKPRSAEELVKTGDCLRGKGNFSEALAYYEKALAAKADGSRGLWLGMGLCYGEMKEDEKAKSCFQQACALDEGNRDAVYHLGITLENLEEDPPALECFQRVVKLRPDDEEAWRNIGFIHLRNERYNQAIEALQKAIDLNPKDWRPHHNLSIAYYDKMKSLLRESMELLGRMPQGNPVAMDDPRQVRLDKISDDLKRNNYFEMSIFEAKEETRLAPDDPESWYDLGTVYLHNTRRYGKEARSALEEALRLKPDYYEALRNMLSVLERGRLPDYHSLEYYSSALLAKWPNDVVGLNCLCEAKYGLGDIEGTLALANKSISLDGEQATSWFFKALALRKLGQAGAANDAYEKAKSLDPEGMHMIKYHWEHEGENGQ